MSNKFNDDREFLEIFFFCLFLLGLAVWKIVDIVFWLMEHVKIV